MRGPQIRQRYDIRRLWRCPECGYERRAPASVTSLRCHCRSEAPLMRLIEGQRLVRPPAEPLDPYINADAYPDDAPSAESVDAANLVDTADTVEEFIEEQAVADSTQDSSDLDDSGEVDLEDVPEPEEQR